jgi:hypothetical protein
MVGGDVQRERGDAALWSTCVDAQLSGHESDVIIRKTPTGQRCAKSFVRAFFLPINWSFTYLNTLHSIMAPKRKQADASQSTSGAQSLCMLCNVVHAAGMTSRHEEGHARPGALASAMLDDRLVEAPLHKRRRRTKKNPQHFKGSTLPGVPSIQPLDKPPAFNMGDDVDAMESRSLLAGEGPGRFDIEQELEALRQATQAGPWEVGLEDDEDGVNSQATSEAEGGEQDEVDELYDPAEDDEVGLEAWMVEMEEAAKRDIQNFGKQ